MAKSERIVRTKHTFAIGAAVTTLTVQGSQVEQEVGMIMLVLPNWTNVVTATLEIKDADGYVMLSKTGVARNTTTKYNGSDGYWVSGAYSIVLTLSGAPGGSGGTAYVVTYGRATM